MESLFNLDHFRRAATIFSFTKFGTIYYGGKLQKDIMFRMFGPIQKLENGHKYSKAMLLPQKDDKITEHTAMQRIKDILAYKVLPASGNFAFYKISKNENFLAADLIIPAETEEAQELSAYVVNATDYVKGVEKLLLSSTDYVKLIDNYKEECTESQKLYVQQNCTEAGEHYKIKKDLGHQISLLLQDELDKGTQSFIREIKDKTFSE